MTKPAAPALTAEPGDCSPRKPGRPRDARADEAILAATLKLVSEHGVAGLNVDAVAAEAGCSKATIYRRWASKEELVVEALSSGVAPIEVPDCGSVRAELELYFDKMLERFAKGRVDVVPQLVQAGTANAALRASLEEYMRERQKSLRAILRRGVARGEVSRDLDQALVIDVLLGAFQHHKLFGNGGVDPAFVRRLIDFAVGKILSA